MKKIDNKPSKRFYEWLKASKEKQTQYIKEHNYEIRQRLNKVNKNIQTLNSYKKFPNKKQECYLIYKK